MIRLDYDMDAGTLYINLSDHPIARTRDIDDNTSVDLAADGTVVGIEVISVQHPWALSTILDNYQIASAETAQLQAYFRPAAPTLSRAFASVIVRVPELRRIQSQGPMLPVQHTAPRCAV